MTPSTIEAMAEELESARARNMDLVRELDYIKMSNADFSNQVGGVIQTAVENATLPLEERIRHLENELRAATSEARAKALEKVIGETELGPRGLSETANLLDEVLHSYVGLMDTRPVMVIVEHLRHLAKVRQSQADAAARNAVDDIATDQAV